MPRLSTLAVLALLFAVVVVAPATADHTVTHDRVTIGIPDYVPIDGSLDMVVVTGAPTGFVPDITCGTEARSTVIHDFSKGVHGAFANVLFDTPLEAGTRFMPPLLYAGQCQLPDGTVYRLYRAWVEEG